MTEFMSSFRAGLKPGRPLSWVLAYLSKMGWGGSAGSGGGGQGSPREEAEQLAHAAAAQAEGRPHRSAEAQAPPTRRIPSTHRLPRDPEDVIHDHEVGRHLDGEDGPQDDCGLCED